MKLHALTVGLAATAALGCATGALAQAKKATPAAAPAPAAAAAPAPVITATVPGACVLSREGLVGASTVGKYVSTRMGQLSNQVNAELTGEQTSIQNDAKALDAKKATLADAAYQQQRNALQQRVVVLQDKASQRDRELQATEQKAVARVLQEASPLVGDAVKAKACGLLLDANMVLAGNPNMDITPAVVTALNAKMTQFDFEREHLDAQAAAPQAR
jgi:Skp family chaperone for outer membrane proteins